MTEFKRISTIFNQLEKTDGGKNLIKHLERFAKYTDGNAKRGWERWLQYEMFYLLSEDEQVKLRIPRFEAQYTYDEKTPLPKGIDANRTASIDLTYEIANTQIGLFHAIELKMARGIKASIREGLIDLLRIRAIQEKDWNFRSITSISIFTEYIKNTKLTDDLKAAREVNFEIIQLTNSYSALLLGWNTRPNNKSRRDAYNTWCSNLDLICKNNQIDVW